MTRSHQFNQVLGRFEPTTTLCRYCNKRHSTKINDTYFVPVFKVADRTNIIVYSSVKFNKIAVGIPRCRECAAIHEDSHTKAWLITFGIIGAFVLIMYLTWTPFWLFFMVFGFALILVGGPHWIPGILANNQGILDKKEGAEKEPLVREMIQQGWSLKQPTA